ncbi:hypothetical protein ABZ766_15180 [Streptomyces sp. NPDC006670]|uniref:hypothetical protein n=1 Tax=Streptomyces sp. NPDC006670 TaxID=3154476 RepID=UPI0033C96188
MGSSNNGINATGGSHVVSSAVASGRDARAAVHTGGSARAGDGRQQSPEEIRELVSRLIEELGRSDHPDRADLIEVAEDAREELTSENRRTGKLRMLARTLVSAVAGFSALASLARPIEEAVRGL